MSDLCETCQKNTTKLLRAANLPDHEKSECVRQQQDHLGEAQTERTVYTEACKKAEEFFKPKENTTDLSLPHAPCSTISLKQIHKHCIVEYLYVIVNQAEYLYESWNV